MRFLTWFLTVALLFAWPELTAALAETAVWSVQQPVILIGGLLAIGARRVLARAQRQAARGWVS